MKLIINTLLGALSAIEIFLGTATVFYILSEIGKGL